MMLLISLDELLDLLHRRDGVADDLAGAFGAAAVLVDAAARRLRRARPMSSTVAVISSRAAAVSSTEAACCSVRRDRSSAAGTDLVGAGLDGGGVRADPLHGLAQLLHRGVEVAAQLVDRLDERFVDAHRQVAVGETQESGTELVDGAFQALFHPLGVLALLALPLGHLFRVLVFLFQLLLELKPLDAGLPEGLRGHAPSGPFRYCTGRR